MHAAKDILIPGTLVSRVVKSSLSPILPINCVFNPSPREVVKSKCGIVDSLTNLSMTEIFIKPYSEEHILATLLVRASYPIYISGAYHVIYFILCLFYMVLIL